MKKYIFVISMLLISSIISWRFHFRNYMQEDTVNIHTFPRQVGSWSSEELTITDEEYDILETRNAFARRYTDAEGNIVDLFIVYSQTNRKVSHPPEVCYLGSGVSITNKIQKSFDVSLAVGEAKSEHQVIELVLEQNWRQQISYYWFKVGDTFTASYWKQQLLIAYKTLLGQNSSSAMIRISSNVVDSNVEKSTEDVEKFTREIIPKLFEYLP